MNKCLYCKKLFDRPFRKGSKFKISWSNYSKMKFCSTTCSGKWQSIHKKGKNNPNYKGGKSRCADCGKELAYRYSWRKGIVRCRSCHFKFLQENPENTYNWKGGISVKKCTICGGKVGDHYSKICRKCYRGENHPWWNGGTSRLSALIRKLPEYKNWYLSVFKRDNWTCQECNLNEHKANSLSAHHIKSFGLILKENNITSIESAIACKELWDINNGITLCRKCHKKTPSFAKKLS